MAGGDDMVVRVTVRETKGSAPRDAGATMWVTKNSTDGTIGGGNLEFQAIDQARKLLDADGETSRTQTYALGPLLDQCCGGSVVLSLDKMSAVEARSAQGAGVEMRARYPLFMFGAGHVGRAVYRAIEPLPFRLHWHDTRASEFPNVSGDHVTVDHEADPLKVVAGAPEGALYLVFTHSHPLDYDIVKAVLVRGDARYCGLIGSKTKRARFENRLLGERVVDEAALKSLTCPIGIKGITGKEPEIIAASVAAQLLQFAEIIED